MDYHHRDSHSSVPLLDYYLLTIPASFKYPPTGTALPRLNNARFARPGVRATLLAGLLALLWMASPQAWSQTIAWNFTAGGQANGSPAIGGDGTTYFGSSDGGLYAVQSNGAPKWSFHAGGPVVSAPALGSDETVYFGSLDRSLYAVQ